MPAITIPALLDRLDAGAGVIVPTPRAAAELRAAYGLRQRTQGQAAWQAAPILSWSQWTGTLWNDLILAGFEQRLLLNAAQEHSLWLEVIADAGVQANASLVSTDSLAALAQTAWQLASTYNAIPRLRTSATTQDTQIFAAWAEEFSQRCASRSYLSSAQLDHALHLHIQTGNLTAPPSLHLAGFADLKPSQHLLLDAFREHNTEFVESTLEAEPGAEAVHASAIAPTEREELTLTALHIRDILNRQPNARIAVLLPDLTTDRAELEAIFRELLAPELQSIAADLSSTPWEISGGPPLSALPLIADALALARWATGPLPLPRASSLLLSPYLGDAANRDAAAVFDANILRRQKLLRPEIDIASLLRLDNAADLPWLRNIQLHLQREDLTRPSTYADWMAFLRGLATAANWPGTRALNATGFAATVAFDGILDLVSTLDFSGRRVPFATALEALERQAQTTAFTPPSTNAQVQGMSVAESEGTLFDAVLFLRSTDANWPPAAGSNPLLSWQLQRSLQMPGADPILTTQRARDLTASLLQRTPHVLFTSAASNADGHLRPSTLLNEFKLDEFRLSELNPTPTSLPFTSPKTPAIQLDRIPDDTPLPPLPTTDVHGGANLLKLQAACGFQAFARLRLHASEPDDTTLGLDAAENGSLLHAVMQHLWQTITTREELALFAPEERSELLHFCIDKALQQEPLRLLSSWDDAYHDLLRERLHRLLLPWLDIELARAPFTVIATERCETVTVGPLTLNVRVDRIDQVAGGTMLIDYKTGSVASPTQWQGERPDEPQLPLYTLLLEPHELKGLAFARLRAGRDMRYAGLQAEDGILPGKSRPADLALEQHNWLTVLNSLAHDFAAGQAVVHPKDYPGTCKHCGQRLLCRLDAATLVALADEGDAADE